MIKAPNEVVLAGFIEEAKGYVPEILQGLQAVREDASQMESLSEVYRLVHSIKGAAAMVGLPALSFVAGQAEELLEEVFSFQREWDPQVGDALASGVEFIAHYLDRISEGASVDHFQLVTVIPQFRRLRGLPESEDEAAIEAVLRDEPIFESQPEPEAETTEYSSGFDDLAPMEGVPDDLIEGFKAEADELLQSISANLMELPQSPKKRDVLLEIRRPVHTLKGAAGMVGMRALGRLAHRMEDLLDRLADEELAVTEDTYHLLLSTSEALDALLRGKATTPERQRQIEQIYGSYSALLGVEQAAALPEEAILPAFEAQPSTEEDSKGEQFIRVPADRLEEMVKLVSELLVNRSVFERYQQSYLQELDEFGMSVDRLKRISNVIDTKYEVSALQGMNFLGATSSSFPSPASASSKIQSEFDALEFDRYTEFHLLSRDLAETVNDLSTAGNKLSDISGDFEGCLTRLGRLTGDLQERIMRLRMVPMGTLTTRLQRTVQLTANRRGKRAELVVEGENVELDKTMLEELTGPLEHLLRNAVDHGIETPDQRDYANKFADGLIVLRASYEGSEAVIQIQDDGAGMDASRLRKLAIERGALTEEEASTLSDEDVCYVVFQPGFSTADTVDEVSGRGIGMDIVQSTVSKLKGTIRISTELGRGTTFTIRLPLTLAITKVLMVRSGLETFAVPLNSVMQVQRVDVGQIERKDGKATVRIDTQVYPLIELGEALGYPPSVVQASRVPVLMMRIGERQIALLVDQLLEARDVVVKNLSSVLKRARGITGATLMGDGSVVLIVNPSELAEETRRQIPTRKMRRETPDQTRTLDIMIVDDSLSVRRVLTNLIQKQGWNVTAAKDGLDALEQIQRLTKQPDVVLMDVEMPRMDGYELTSALRNDTAFRRLPIVMLTSRSGEKHRAKAFELGVNEYLIKPYQEETLLNVVKRVVRENREAVRQ